jgi:phage terminase small subunit
MMTVDSQRLTTRQRRFIAEFLASGNATESARKAGYSETSAERVAFKVLRNPAVKAAIVAAEADKLEELRVTKDRLAARLARIAFANGVELDEMRCTGRDSVAAAKLLLEFMGAFERRLLHRVEALDWKALLASGPESTSDDE